MPKISIIIPCLNVVRYVRECMDSAVNQTIEDVEIIVIDGGSTDGTLEVLKEYALLDERISLLHSEVKSYGHQVNMGIDRARGEYIAILESDDYVDTNMYKSLCQVADEYQTDVTKADFDRFYSLSNGYREFTRIRFWDGEEENYNRVLNPREHMKMFCNDYFLWKGIYRRQFIEDNHIRLHETPGAAFQDIGFLQQVMAVAGRVIYTDDSFYRYRIDRDESSSYSPKVLKYGHDEFKWLLDMHVNHVRELYMPGLLSHMMQGFTGQMRVSLNATSYDLESEYIRPYFDWYRAEMSELLSMDMEAKYELYDITYEQFDEVFNHIDSYIERMREQDARLMASKKSLDESIPEKAEVVVFGSGARGRAVIRQLDGRCNIVAIADNSSEKHGTRCMGYSVIEPCVCAIEYSNANYVIAVKGHELEIREQLMGLGIGQEYIVEYSM